MSATAVVVASPLHESSRLSRYVSEFLSKIPGMPFSGVLTEPVSLDAIAAVIFVATGGTEHVVLEIVEKSRLRYVLLVYHDFENSLPAVLEVVPALKTRVRVGVVKLDRVSEFVEPVLTASRAARSILGSKLLVLGKPSPWLVYSSGVEEVLRSKLGVDVEYVDMNELYSEYREMSEPGELGELATRSSVGEESLRASLRLYLTIGSLLRNRGARAVSVRCFDIIKDIGIAGCLALSKLLDEGVVAGCEADLPSAVTMMVLRELTGSPPWMANVVGVSSGVIELAHCTIATTLTCDYALTTHFESGLPTAVSGRVEEGTKATIAKYDPKRNLIRAALGKVIEGAPRHSARCRTQVSLRVPEEYSRKILEDPVGAHVVVAFADVAKSLEVLGDMLGINTEVYS